MRAATPALLKKIAHRLAVVALAALTHCTEHGTTLAGSGSDGLGDGLDEAIAEDAATPEAPIVDGGEPDDRHAVDVPDGTDAPGDVDAADEAAERPRLLLQVIDREDGRPLAEAVVFVQRLGGEEWPPVDARGEFAVEAVDFEADPPTVTIFAEGYTWVTLVELDRPLSGPIEMAPTESRLRYRVVGTVSGLAPTQRALVSLPMDDGYFAERFADPLDGRYLVDVLAGDDWRRLDGQVFAIDAATGRLENWTTERLDLDCRPWSCPELTMDFTLPTPAAAIDRATVEFSYPDGWAGLPLIPPVLSAESVRYAMSLTAGEEPPLRLGLVEAYAASSPPPRASLTAAWVADLGGMSAERVRTAYRAGADDRFAAAAVMVCAGVPVDGLVVPVRELPAFSVPADADEPLHLSTDTAAWTVPAGTTMTRLTLYASGFRPVLWRVLLPPHVSSFRFPALPASFPAWIGTASLGIGADAWRDPPASIWDVLDRPGALADQYLGGSWDARYHARR